MKRSLSLNKRLSLLVATILIPLVILICYLLVSLMNFCQAYDQIIWNIRYANEYCADFKRKIDDSMYLAVIQSVTFAELGEEQNTIEPYEYMEKVRENCNKLMDVATSSQSRRQVVRMQKSLDTLKDRIHDIEVNLELNLRREAPQSELHKQNIELWENSVCILTEIMEDAMHEYIYYESVSFGSIQSELTHKQNVAIQMSLVALIIILVFSLILATKILRSVTNPIHQLCNVAEQAAKGDFTARADFKTDDEVSVLRRSFNHMTEEIGRLVEGVKVEQANLRVTESQLMQAQINPHFLYNTLDTIVWLAEEKQTQEVVSVVTSLSDFFRAMLSDGKDYVSIKEEAKHVRSYLEIQHMRYQDILEYEIHIDEDIQMYIIPKLMIQPLVENALYHGIKNKRGMGKITIKGYRRHNEIILEVQDNGAGMRKEKMEELNGSVITSAEENQVRSGFGIGNVRERIHAYYGKEYGIFYESEEGKGTRVIIVLPAKNIEPFS